MMLLMMEKHRVDASLCGIARTGSKGVSHSERIAREDP